MTIRRKVKRVVDGDTLEVRNKVKGTNFIRLADVNAPERGERGYGSAKSRLTGLVGKTITLQPRGWSYNRLVADVRYRRKKIP